MRGRLLVLASAVVLLAAGGCSMQQRAAREEARRLTGGDPDRGAEAIGRYGCAACHTIPGIRGPDGTVGPPLTGVARRGYLAGQLTNSPENMARWIQRPQQVEQGTAMPNMGVTDEDARHITAYLYTLR